MYRIKRLWMMWMLLLGAGCASTVSAPRSPPAPTPAERSSIFTRYSYFELYSALELLEYAASAVKPAEGESSLGCRLDREKAQTWISPLRAAVEEAAAKERVAYQENQLKYQRSRGFDHCAPKCTCSALMKVVGPVSFKSLRSQEARIAHREYLRKLTVKTVRASAEEQRTCAERQNWFCASDLREFFERESSSQKAR